MLEAPQGQHGLCGLPALVALLRICSDPRLRVVFHGQDPVAEGKALLNGKRHEAPGAFIRHDLEMVGLASDDAAERHGPRISRTAGARSLEPYSDRGRDFQGARHLHHIERRAGGRQGRGRTRQQHVVDVVIEPSFDDQKMRAR